MKDLIAILLLSIIVLVISTSILGIWGFVLFIGIVVAVCFSMIMNLENRIIELEKKLNEVSSEKSDSADDNPSVEVTE